MPEIVEKAFTQAIPRCTPQQQLNSHETVLYDTRLHFFAAAGGRVIWFCIGSALVPSIAFGLAEGMGSTSPGLYALLFWGLLVLLPLLTRVLSWRNEFYSLTDQRILHGYGVISRTLTAKQLARIGGMLDVSTYRITGVTFGQGMIGRLLNFGTLRFQTNHGDIVWSGIKGPLKVRRLIEEKIVAFQTTGANQETYNEAVIKRMAEIRTDANFGLVEPKHLVSFPENAGGLNLQQAPSTTHYCPHCGGQHPGDAAYCVQCGKQLR